MSILFTLKGELDRPPPLRLNSFKCFEKYILLLEKRLTDHSNDFPADLDQVFHYLSYFFSFSDTDTDTGSYKITVELLVSVSGCLAFIAIILCVYWVCCRRWTQASKINADLSKVAFLTFYTAYLVLSLKRYMPDELSQMFVELL